MKNKIDYSLYVVTDRDMMSSHSIEESVERAIKGGATIIQLREKKITPMQFYRLAYRVKSITDQYGVPLIINDDIRVARAVGAAGVHVGQSDSSCTEARAYVGKDKIVGVSVTNVEQAIQAQNDGADYLGVGAMFATRTKADAANVSIQELKRIRQSVNIPIVVIGGIQKQTIPAFAGTGIDGIAVVSAVVAQQDPTAAAKELKQLFYDTINGKKRVLS